MPDEKVIDQLLEAFRAPLQDDCVKRIVFWHDVEGSFAEDFKDLIESGFGDELERLIHFVSTEEGSLFALKRDVLREHADDDYLIYTRSPRDFSQGGLDGNWLADVEITSEHFQADKASMLLGDLNASSSAHTAISGFEKFFAAAGRKAAYLKVMPESLSGADVGLGVIAVILGTPTAKVEDIVKAYLISLYDGSFEQTLSELEKYNALGAFTQLLDARIGYAQDITDLQAVASHLLVSAASCTLPTDVLNGYESRISKPHARFCMNIVRDWLGDTSKRPELYDISRLVENELNIPTKLQTSQVLELADTDVLPSVNEVILTALMNSMADGADRSAEALSMRQRRKDLKWFKRVSCYYDLLAAAAEADTFYKAHPQGFHVAKPDDAWKQYTTDWYAMDTAYRQFCDAYDACQLNKEDVPDGLTDASEKLAERIENLYVNWFLPGVNNCWVNAAEADWAERGYVSGIKRQQDFYHDYVLHGASDYKRTMVIISDGMRYEVGLELARLLEQGTKATVDISSMQSIFPSVTEFGMAALLPHQEISYSWDDGKVFVDGKQTVSTPQRQTILKDAKPGAKAILAGELRSGNRASRKELVGDSPLIYVYQDKIDSTGEKLKLVNDVFIACTSTIEELFACVKTAINDLGISRVIITADHGFLYTRGTLKEQDKISKADIGKGDLQLHRRHILSRDSFDDSVLINMNMRDIHGGEYYGLALRECIRMKSVPGNKNYAHGGVSLEEMCVPVIEVRNRRTGSAARTEQQKAEMSLVSTSRRITSSMFHVDLFQREPVSGKVLPAEYELFLTDGSGNVVTDTQKAHADMTSLDERARVSRPMFTLRAGMEYPAGERYYLVCRDKDTGAIIWKEEFTIDMAFAPTVDFGF